MKIRQVCWTKRNCMSLIVMVSVVTLPTKGALNMAKLGFSVKELMGGIEWWRRDGYETEGKQGVNGKEVVCGC